MIFPIVSLDQKFMTANSYLPQRAPLNGGFKYIIYDFGDKTGTGVLFIF
jgi:hypothetical protein